MAFAKWSITQISNRLNWPSLKTVRSMTLAEISLAQALLKVDNHLSIFLSEVSRRECIVIALRMHRECIANHYQNDRKNILSLTKIFRISKV